MIYQYNKGERFSMNKKKDIKEINYIKAFAMFSVLILHLSIPEEYSKKYILSLYTVIGVPIFMIITGHNYMLSYEKSNVYLKKWFDWENLYKKLKRVLFPYIYIILAEIIVVFIKNDFLEYRSIKSILFFCIKGGTGPGSFYGPTLIQIILFYFPILLFFNICIIRTNKERYRAIYSLIIVFIFEFLYEIFINYMKDIYSEILVQQIYRMIAMRHIVFLQVGIILYYYKEKIFKNFIKIIPFSIVGAIYIYMVDCKGYILFPYYYWKEVATPMVFYALFFIVIILKYLKNIDKNFFESIINTIGKASYHIFLIQMLYFGMLRIVIFNNGLDYILDLAICVSIGIMYYYIEPKITKNLDFFMNKLVKKFRKK